MTVEQWRLFYAFGGLLFTALLLIAMPEWVAVVGFAFGLWLLWWVSPFRQTWMHARDELYVWWESRGIDKEHERL